MNDNLHEVHDDTNLPARKDDGADRKAPLHLLPPWPLRCEAEAFRLGARKYGAYGWRSGPVAAGTYYAAVLRHVMAWWDGEEEDAESGQSHLAHARACLAILLDAAHHGLLHDDRPANLNAMTLNDELRAHYERYARDVAAASAVLGHLHADD